MPKLINRPPKYSLHKPSGQAKVRFNGKTTYLGRHGTQASLDWFWTVQISNISSGKKLRNHKTGVALCALSSTISSGASWWTVGGRATPAAWNTLPQVPCTSSLNRNRFPFCWTSVVCN
jgi:hypothetical protein